jgi:general secretion pathway protein G
MNTPEIEVEVTGPRAERPALTELIRNSERGMTLVEIMIVLAIMASIMGMVGFFARGAIINSNIKQAQTQIGTLMQAVDSYYVFRNEWPDNLGQLADPPQGMAPILERLPEDPWNNEYQYSRESDTVNIYSTGPDGNNGGGDDVCMAGREDDCN